MIEVKRPEPKELEGLIPLYQKFLNEIDCQMTDEQILKSLMLCDSNRGLLLIATDNGLPVAVSGGIFNADVFIGEIAYIKNEYRYKLNRFIKEMIIRIKSRAKFWDIICAPERYKLWSKLNFKCHKVWFRRAL